MVKMICNFMEIVCKYMVLQKNVINGNNRKLSE